MTGWGKQFLERKKEKRRKNEILLWKWKTLKTTGWLSV